MKLNPAVAGVAVGQPEPESRNSREFFRIAAISSAIGLGCGVGSLQSLRWDASGISFHISLGTYIAFAIGAVAALVYWKFATGGESSARRGSLLLLLGGVGLFLYPLRFVPAEKLPDIAIGLGIAASAISGVVFMLLQVKHFLDQDTRDFETAKHSPVGQPDQRDR